MIKCYEKIIVELVKIGHGILNIWSDCPYHQYLTARNTST